MEDSYRGETTRAKEYGVRWQEFDRNDRIVTKEKVFRSNEALDKFIDKIVEKDNFYQIVAHCF